MSNNAPDYQDNLYFDPEIDKVLNCDIEKLQKKIDKLEKQLNIAVETITALAIVGKYSIAIEALQQIEELNK